jgi:hypothetical protein
MSSRLMPASKASFRPSPTSASLPYTYAWTCQLRDLTLLLYTPVSTTHAVDMAISRFQCMSDSFFDFASRALPRSKSYGWDLGARIESESSIRHFVRLRYLLGVYCHEEDATGRLLTTPLQTLE